MLMATKSVIVKIENFHLWSCFEVAIKSPWKLKYQASSILKQMGNE